MKLNKIIIILSLLVMTGLSVFADANSPVVTKRKKIEKQVETNENVQKTTPQKKSTSVSQPSNINTVKYPVKKPYPKVKMGVTMYPGKNNQSKSQAGKSYCSKCKYPKSRRVYW